MNIFKNDIFIFTKQLSILLDAHIPIGESCKILAQQCEKPSLRQLIHKIQFSLEQGRSLSETLAFYPKYFNLLYQKMIKVGEYSGKLNETLKQLVLYQEKSLHLNQSIRQSLRYPVILLITFTALVLLFLFSILPTFEKLFMEWEQPLPTITLTLLKITSFFKDDGLWILSLMLLIIFLLKKSWQHFSLKLPILGHVLKKNILVNSLRTLGITLSAGLPLMECLSLSAEISLHPLFKKAYQQIQSEVSIGYSLHHAMQKTDCFPVAVLSMIYLGENSGTLDQLLLKSAEILEKELDNSLSSFRKMLEPCLILSMGLIIGIFMLALYLPLFSMGNLWA